MKAWKSSLLWASYPFLILLSVFGLIATVNWDYESKLIFLNNSSSEWHVMHLGPILLAYAMGEALIASLLLFLVHFFWPKSYTTWFMVPLALITIFLIFPGLFIVILGPAAITMMEQTQSISK